MEFDALAIKALNHWRHLSPPTYLGLRLLLGHSRDIERIRYLESVVLRKQVLRTHPRYRTYLQFKGILPNGEKQYRRMCAASPTAALSEAVALQALSAIPSLRDKEHVYSYRWPRSRKAGHSFQYFIDGYNKRIDHVSALVGHDPDASVLVLDIKNFYPSLNRSTVVSRFAWHLDQQPLTDHRPLIESLIANSLEASREGIPVGNPLGHVMANVGLEDIDSKLIDRFKHRYSRYVDDILLVVPTSAVDTSKRTVSEILALENLKLNEEKTDIISAKDWLNHANERESLQQLAGQYQQWLNQIRGFLMLFPSSIEHLSAALSELRISIPLKRFLAEARYPRYQLYIANLLKHRRLRLSFSSDRAVRQIVTGGTHLRTHYQEEFRRCSEEMLVQRGYKRRWQIQKTRFLVGRLIYLLQQDEYVSLLQQLHNAKELLPLHSLLQAAISGKPEPLIGIPGVATHTFSALVRDGQVRRLDQVEAISHETEGEQESILSLLFCRGIRKPPPDFQSSGVCRRMHNFATALSVKSRLQPDNTYEDELNSLHLSISTDRYDEIWASRYSDKEVLGLEALGLGNYWGMSG